MDKLIAALASLALCLLVALVASIRRPPPVIKWITARMKCACCNHHYEATFVEGSERHTCPRCHQHATFEIITIEQPMF